VLQAFALWTSMGGAFKNLARAAAAAAGTGAATGVPDRLAVQMREAARRIQNPVSEAGVAYG